MMAPLAYDVGMNNGDDSRYYLDKGFSVIGIEADPSLCAFCRDRFRDEIASGRMTVVNVGVGLDEGESDFYINKRQDTLSTFRPDDHDSTKWEIKPVQMRRLSSLIREFGIPTYVKIDVEHHDHFVLIDLYNNSICPPYISAEAHTIEIYCVLVMMGYEQFALVEGEKVAQRYGNHRIRRIDGTDMPYSFELHTSGPFGDDLDLEWVGKLALLKQLLACGLGWVDIHARRLPGDTQPLGAGRWG